MLVLSSIFSSIFSVDKKGNAVLFSLYNEENISANRQSGDFSIMSISPQ